MTIRPAIVTVLALFCAVCPSPARGTREAVRRGAPGGVHRSRAVGTAVVRVTTDAHEKIVDVTILKSTGSRPLDRYAVADTRDHWHGAVSSIEEVKVKYTPGPDGQPRPEFQLKPR